MADLDVSFIALRLDRHAAAFSGLVDGVAEAQARWPPERGKWSILEVVNHLADEEELDFRMRLQILLERPDADWPAIAPERWAVERGYPRIPRA